MDPVAKVTLIPVILEGGLELEYYAERPAVN
jgi:hypothetical protein